jgi:hypothetical protein
VSIFFTALFFGDAKCPQPLPAFSQENLSFAGKSGAVLIGLTAETNPRLISRQNCWPWMAFRSFLLRSHSNKVSSFILQSNGWFTHLGRRRRPPRRHKILRFPPHEPLHISFHNSLQVLQSEGPYLAPPCQCPRRISQRRSLLSTSRLISIFTAPLPTSFLSYLVYYLKI